MFLAILSFPIPDLKLVAVLALYNNGIAESSILLLIVCYSDLNESINARAQMFCVLWNHSDQLNRTDTYSESLYHSSLVCL